MKRLFSPAKLNWYLRVMQPREDGYHELVSVFQELGIGDELHFELQDQRECVITGFPPDIATEKNLVYRAWKLLAGEFGVRVAGLQVNATKNLPRGGGLGGGSSNAAAALIAVNELNSLNLTDDDLERYGAQLGSDVSFFIRGGCAVGKGRGEQLVQVHEIPSYHLVLYFPNEGVPTREAFQHLDSLPNRPVPAHDEKEIIEALRSGNPLRVAPLIYNDFELVVADKPWYVKAKQIMKAEGAARVFLCGSGSSVAGLLPSKESALKIVAKYGSDWSYTISDASYWGRRSTNGPGNTTLGETS